MSRLIFISEVSRTSECYLGYSARLLDYIFLSKNLAKTAMANLTLATLFLSGQGPPDMNQEMSDLKEIHLS